MEKILKDQKQMLDYLHKQAEEHVKTREMLIQMNEELEKEINKQDKVIIKVKKELDAKEKRLHVFEEEFEIEFDETIKIRDRAEMYKAETKKFCKQLENAELKLNSMEKKKEISDKLLRTVQTDNVALKAKLENTVGKISDVDRLLEDIELIKKINKEKEDTLEEIIKENRTLKENLVNLEKETEALKEEDAENANEKAYEINLSDELGIADPRALNVSPAFEPSSLNNHDVKYHGNTLVKKIWKLKQIQLEKSINSQKLKLTSDLLQLKEKEFSGSVNCACRTFCRITHKKHNWKKSTSQEMFLKFKLLDRAYSCENCDNTFQNVDCLKLHMKTFHEEGKMGEISVNNTSKASGGRLI